MISESRVELYTDAFPQTFFRPRSNSLVESLPLSRASESSFIEASAQTLDSMRQDRNYTLLKRPKKLRINWVSEGVYRPSLFFAANAAHAELAAFSDPAHDRYPLASYECPSGRSL
jgi:hypothetical protein